MMKIVLLAFFALLTAQNYVWALPVARNITTNIDYNTLYDALTAAKNKETIQLVGNATDEPDATIIIKNDVAKEITLDLNGYVFVSGRVGRHNAANGNIVLGGCIIRVGNSSTGKHVTLNIVDSRPKTKHYGTLVVDDRIKDLDWNHLEVPKVWKWNRDVVTSGADIVEIDGGIITGGFSSSGGDDVGINVVGGNTVNLKGGNVVGNILTEGGGCAFRLNGPQCRLNISGGSIAYNVCPRNAAAVLGHGGVTMTGGEVHHNVAGMQGGAFRVPSNSGPCFFKMTGGSIHDNHSGNDGGAINVGDGGGTNVTRGNVTVDISGGSIYNNTTTGMGGAICTVFRNYNFIEQGKTYTMTVNISDNARIYNNEAAQGGAIYIAYGNLNITGGDIFGNKANPGSFSYSIGVRKTNTSIETDIVSINSPGEGGAFYMANGNVTLDGESLNITGNSSTGHGGAFFIAQPENYFTKILHGSLSNNSAAGQGGAVYLKGKSDVNLTNAVLENNRASNGGGMFITDGAVMKFTDGIIRGNTVTSKGGGVYVDKGSSIGKTSLLLGGNELGIYSNTADTEGDDIFINGSETLIFLPNIFNMSLTGFVGNASGLNWYKDFSTHRYRGHREDDNIYNVPDDGVKLTNGPLALTMGYKGVDLIIRQMGVNEGETIIYTIKDQEDLSKILYRVALSGVSQQSVRGLPMKEYVVAPTRWSWAYQSLSGKTQHLQDNNVFEFEAVHKTDDASAGAPMHNEISETNELNGTSH